MPLQIKLPSGLVISTAASEVKQQFKDISFWANDFPSQCGNCKGRNIVPEHHRNQDGNDFFHARCLDCKYEAAFGQHKTGGTLFFKNEWKPPFRKSDTQPASGAALEDGDEIPY